jgi:hypothetical protein
MTSGVLVASCIAPMAPPTRLPTPTSMAALTETAKVIVAPTVMPATVTVSPSTGSGEKVNLDAYLPPDRGRDLLIANCGTCHSWVCAVRGQRSAEHTERLKEAHRDKVGALPGEDYDLLFAYLANNFNDTKPEPQLPEPLSQMGCGSGTE